MMWYNMAPVGLAQMQADLMAIGAVSKKSGMEAIIEVAPLIVDQVKANINSRTGTLAASVGWTASSEGVSIFATAPYAIFVEEGTSKQAAQYYMKRAIDQYVDGGADNTGIVGEKIRKKVYEDSQKYAIASSAGAVAKEAGLAAPLLVAFSFLMMGFAGIMSRY